MKDTKKSQKPNRDPQVNEFSYDTNFNNRLTLPKALQAYLKELGLDWRFLNAMTFRSNGGMHRSHWQPFKVPADKTFGLTTTAEGLIQRDDLILGVRKKEITAQHKRFLAERTKRQSGHSKEQAQQLRKMAQEAGLDSVKVSEGYEEDSKGYKSAED